MDPLPSSSKQGPSRKGSDSRRKSNSSEAQRERKRQTDRKSQQASRARTKAYIAYLEKQTNALAEVNDGSGSEPLTKRLKEQFTENERLKSVLQGIGKLIKEVVADDQPAAPIDDTPSQDVASDEWPKIGSNESAQNAGRSDSYSPGEESTSLDLACGEGHRNYFMILNQALTFVEASGSQMPCPSIEIDEDINLRAILHSWDAANAKHPLDVGWQMLRLVDQGLFFRSGAVERIAILRIMRAMFLTANGREVAPERKPPTYMHPTTLQASVQHPRLVDYFAWPSTRDHLIVTGTSNVPEWLTAQFASDAGFTWDYHLRDVAKCRSSSNTYAFSEEFNKVFHQLDSWYFKSTITSSLFPPHKESLHDAVASGMPQPHTSFWPVPMNATAANGNWPAQSGATHEQSTVFTATTWPQDPI